MSTKKSKEQKPLSFTAMRTINDIAKNLKEGEDYTIERSTVPVHTKEDIGNVNLCVCVRETEVWIQVYNEKDRRCRKNSIFQSKDIERITEKYNETCIRIINEGRAKLSKK